MHSHAEHGNEKIGKVNTYEGFPMTCTLDESGRLLTLTEEGVTYPADYSFEKVNDFVHATETQYEDLESLALGMASHIEALNKLLVETQFRYRHYEPTRHNNFMKKIDEVLNGP